MVESQKLRTTGVFFLFIFLYGILLFNLILTQVYQGNFFNTLGRRQYAMSVTLDTPRGEIIDRRGRVVAHNKESIAAFALPKKLEDQKSFEGFLEHHFPEALARFARMRNQNFFYIKRKLTQDELDLIQNSGVTDIKLLKEQSRYYPVFSTGTVVGITDIDNKGLFGIEKVFDTYLTGTPATVLLEREARSGLLYFSKELTKTGEVPKVVQLTLDADLQFLAREELKETVEKFKAESGVVIIMDPQQGDVLTMAHFPDFNPNNTQNLDQETTRNKGVTDVHELGSVMKTFVALAAFEEDVVDPNEIIDCENKKSTTILGMPINTVTPHDKLTFEEVMAKSNNIGIAKVALRLGPKLYDHYQRLGFGSLSGLNFPGEQRGTITHPSRWSKKSLFSLSYGYEISANLVQLARAFSIIARDGLEVSPRLVLNPLNDSRQENVRRLYSMESIQKIKNILRKTVEKGTAYRARIEGYELMGKTGSVDMLINGKYDKNRSIFTFAGIVQKGDYQRVIVTFIKNVSRKELYAASVTAPLFRNVAEKMLIHDKQV